jgi:signal transduction histidine kinase
LPSKIADNVEEAYLLVSNPINGKFESADHWVLSNQLTELNPWDPMAACTKCLEKSAANKPSFHLCRQEHDKTSQYVYSLGISNQNIPTTVLKFKLKSDICLSRYEEKIFKNIGDEIVVALQASQDRKRLSEMQSAEVAMAERRMVSAYVHDQLGQNLGYLHLKLDQLAANESSIRSKEVRKDLKHLQEVANKSYEIVRDILKKMQPETIPHLTNLLREHARTVSRRTNISLNFKSTGDPRHLATNTQQIIFFTFREILSNVEKHARASHIDVVVAWQEKCIEVSVADNGNGFDPEQVQKNEHFGLDIMQERIAIIKGKLMIRSSENSGTFVSISVPIESSRRPQA